MDSAHKERLQGLFMVLMAMFAWSVGPLFVKYFAGYYNVWTQNAFRYSSAAIMLLIFAAWNGSLRHKLTPVQWKRLILVAAANITMQITYAGAYYFIYPAVGSLVGRVNIIFITVLSFIIFHDERRVIRSPRFLLGAALALIGVCVVIIGRDPELLVRLQVTERDFWIGVGIVVAFAFFHATYSLSIKHAVQDIPSVISFTHVAWMTSLGLCIPWFLIGGVSDLWQQPVLPLGLMIFSAFLCIIIAHTCYYAGLRRVSAAVSSSILQLHPLLICIQSAIIFNEKLTPLQLLGGLGVIIGAWLAAMAQIKDA